jgi:hypothetical protein
VGAIAALNVVEKRKSLAPTVNRNLPVHPIAIQTELSPLS